MPLKKCGVGSLFIFFKLKTFFQPFFQIHAYKKETIIKAVAWKYLEIALIQFSRKNVIAILRLHKKSTKPNNDNKGQFVVIIIKAIIVWRSVR